MSLDAAAARDAIERQIVTLLASELGHGADWSIGPDENLLTGEYLDSLGIKHGGIVDAHYGSGLSFRDPDNIALELFCPPS